MKSVFKVTSKGRGENLDVKFMTFPGGEINTTINLRSSINSILITAWLKDSDGLIALAQLKSILENDGAKEINLLMGYVPYARQDRICNPGESLGIKVFADYINSLKFSNVTMLDPHSDVTPALFDRVRIIDKKQIFSHFHNLNNFDCFVAPDFGASKEVQSLCRQFEKEFIQGVKIRDTKTGELSGFDFYGSVKGKRLLIVDDLCDGGGTFIGLATMLNKGGASCVDMYVTHGMFTKGLGCFDDCIRRIYTTNTFIEDIGKEPKANLIYSI